MAAPEVSLDYDRAQHLFIEGDNLDALKLLEEEYTGRIRMIYIDPPYNTGGTFVYADRIRTPSHEPRVDHRTAWLNMMLPRLVLAHRLLHAEGVLFVSIDDHEVHRLRVVLDELFGNGCFKNAIVLKRGPKNVQAQFTTVGALTVGHEYILMYTKDPARHFPHLEIPLEKPKPGTWNNHWRGTDRPTMRYELFGITPERGQWRWSQARSIAAVARYDAMMTELGAGTHHPQSAIDAWWLAHRSSSGEKLDLLRLSAHGKPEHYVPPSATKLGSDLWTDLSPRGTPDVRDLMESPVFDNPKPLALIQRMLGLATRPNANDIILDFFAGSGSTGHAVVAQNIADRGNRQFILVQTPEPTPARSPARRAGYSSIAEIGRDRIRRALEKQRAENADSFDEDSFNLGFRAYRVEAD